ncbi:exopolysaccharide biosynthesis polyprenyl glycosylphosphotransferase [Nocardioides ginsengisegetis]|uniref:Exopolysaccharide biosynthesis polyprenyl glycosylphosphotransferase n=1 Tax=Nocardioides ginsengisegetis TaxID=661491 RepID=A0A7W3IWC7_9ACTN|nr:sugar transferase [Nocardioides ginsengisegetis]MBA8801861.1 exopolysaccharide biosynthesis polyprenyl glycosylphosphotransferase [Nocardioides ginsengisegetis]
MTLLSVRRERVVTRTPSRALRYLPVSALLLDLAVMLAVGVIAVLGRAHLAVFDTQTDITGSLKLVGPLMMTGWLACIAVGGGYKPNVFGAGTDEYKRLVNASLLLASLTGVGCYLAKFSLSRGFFVLAFGLGIPALVLGRLALRRALHRARRHGALQQRVLIAGSRSHIDEIASVLRREPWLGYHVVGALTPAYDLSEETKSGIPVLGHTDEATDVVKVAGIDVIFFAGGGVGSASQMRKFVWEVEHHSVQVVVAPSVTDISSERIRVRPVGGLPLMHIDPPTAIDASRIGKRVFDVVGSLGLILAFAPLFLVAALRIRLHDGGPVLFRQTRIGREGREFSCLKFRTMVTDAEVLLARLHAEQGYDEGLFKMKDDPRITAPGRWLRRFSIDELPQLVNVLRGDMSLVGPRPPLPREVASYDDDTHRRLRVRPGMTGLWQVSGRSDLSWSEAVRLDLYYVDNWSMLQDLNILGKTLGAVFSSRGAY